MLRRFLALLAALLTVGAPVAAAKVLRAESVLPPGQSGFVSLAGVASGTGSPHLTDQLGLFTSFQRKSDVLDGPGADETIDAPGGGSGVTIKRDAYGVPDVTGASSEDVWWGAGYAIAEDRLFELELFRRATEGHLAEILGKSYLDADVVARRDYYTPAELDAFYAKLPADLRVRFSAYTDGINAWIAHVRVNPSDMPGEFVALADPPRDWTVEDSLAIGVYLARTTPRDDGVELDNLRALKGIGRARFDHVMKLRLAGPVTVPRASGAFPSRPGRSAAQERAAYKRSVTLARTLPLPAPPAAAARAASRRARALTRLGGSYMFAVREPRGKALLFNGPELGFGIPSKLVELEVHGPDGLDARGVTIPGVPLIGIGHNRHVAWGFTSGESDADDLYADRTPAGNPDAYTFRGAQRAMTCRQETFSYRSPPTGLLKLSPPGAGTEKETLCRDVHGPIVARAGNVAYARRYAIWGHELQTLVGLAKLEVAKNVTDVGKAANAVTWNENIMAADDRGHIGFWHPGRLPLRPVGYDERLPYPGDGRAEWRGLLSARQRPHVVDPKQGWLANWNNDPAVGWTNGDGAERPRLDGSLNRVAWLMRLVATLHRKPSYAGAQLAIRRAGTIAQQRPLLTGRLTAALEGSTGKARTVLRTLLAWNGDYATTDAAGTVAPGVATWDAFKAAAERARFGRYLAAALPVRGENSDEHVFDAPNGQAYALRTLGAAGYRRAAASAFAVLAKRFGTTNPATWREPRRMAVVAVQGAANEPKLPFFDRGTWEQLVELGG